MCSSKDRSDRESVTFTLPHPPYLGLWTRGYCEEIAWGQDEKLLGRLGEGHGGIRLLK